ncbi:MAG: hypothetical protein LUE92_16410 [Clostridiales bacterium]|nr:hypothetical protein [Clostridiales bacterium]
MFFEKGDIDIADIVPSQLSYDEVQENQIRETLGNEKSDLRRQSNKQSALIKEEYKPEIKDVAKSAAISAALEGGVAFAQAIVTKKAEGLKIRAFTEDDWIEILQCTGKGTAKGGIRGAAVFSLENFSNTPGSLTSALVTASIGMAEQAHLLRTGKITDQQFIEISETLCLDTAVSAVASLLGQTLIPVPMVGAAIGNSVGMMMYQTARDYLSDREQKIIAGYLDEIRQMSENFDIVYKNYMEQLAHDFTVYIQILQRTYSVDVTEAFQASVDLAKTVGVPCDEILDTKEKVAAFFLN